MSAQPSLTTARLTLRPFTLFDAPATQPLAGSIEVARYTTNMPHPYLDGMAEAWITDQAGVFTSGKGLQWAITESANGHFCGTIGLFIQECDGAVFGYWLGEEFWGKGYTSEAAKAISGFGFSHFKVNCIYAFHYSGNEASGRVMQKVGMKYEGTLRQHLKRWDRYFDAVYYAILASEWE